MTDEFKGVSIALLTTSTYASRSVEMKALLRAKGLWKCTQVLAQDFMKTLEPLTLKERDEIESKFDKALGTIQFFLDPTCKEIARGSLTAKDVWKTLKDQLKGKNPIPRFIYWPFSTQPTRRRISWRRWLRQVNGSHLEKTQWRQAETSSEACRSDDNHGSAPIFRNPKKNSGISKGPFHGYYKERPATSSLKTQSWASSTSRTSSNQSHQRRQPPQTTKSLVRSMLKVCDNTHYSELLEQTWKSWPSAA